jgi:hypothetical protein
VSGAHNALVVNTDVLKKFVKLHVLLRVGSNQIMKLHASDGQHRLAIQLRIVETV